MSQSVRGRNVEGKKGRNEVGSKGREKRREEGGETETTRSSKAAEVWGQFGGKCFQLQGTARIKIYRVKNTGQRNRKRILLKYLENSTKVIMPKFLKNTPVDLILVLQGEI